MGQIYVPVKLKTETKKNPSIFNFDLYPSQNLHMISHHPSFSHDISTIPRHYLSLVPHYGWFRFHFHFHVSDSLVRSPLLLLQSIKIQLNSIKTVISIYFGKFQYFITLKKGFIIYNIQFKIYIYIYYITILYQI